MTQQLSNALTNRPSKRVRRDLRSSGAVFASCFFLCRLSPLLRIPRKKRKKLHRSTAMTTLAIDSIEYLYADACPCGAPRADETFCPSCRAHHEDLLSIALSSLPNQTADAHDDYVACASCGDLHTWHNATGRLPFICPACQGS